MIHIFETTLLPSLFIFLILFIPLYFKDYFRKLKFFEFPFIAALTSLFPVLIVHQQKERLLSEFNELIVHLEASTIILSAVLLVTSLILKKVPALNNRKAFGFLAVILIIFLLLSESWNCHPGLESGTHCHFFNEGRHVH